MGKIAVLGVRGSMGVVLLSSLWGARRLLVAGLLRALARTAPGRCLRSLLDESVILPRKLTGEGVVRFVD